MYSLFAQLLIMSDFNSYLAAEDGQNIYLHSINARCLAFEYGSLEKSPDTIEATIVEVEEASMTEVRI